MDIKVLRHDHLGLLHIGVIELKLSIEPIHPRQVSGQLAILRCLGMSWHSEVGGLLVLTLTDHVYAICPALCATLSSSLFVLCRDLL